MTTSPLNRLRTYLTAPALAASLLLAASASAQTTSPAPATTTVANSEEIIELSPFVVTTNNDVGYVANNTLAGSRTRTNLTDVGNAISVFTPELMSDLGAIGEADLMRYSASAVPERQDQNAQAQGISIDTGGFQFRIRGQVASRSRNYFGSVIIPDVYNSERFEEARGPNAVLFGLGGAGGILNTTTKRALTNKTATTLSFLAGSDSQYRATIDHNQKLNRNLAFRVNTVVEQADGWHPHDFRENQRIHGALTYRPFSKMTVRLEAEYGDVANSLSRNFAAFDNVTQWKQLGSNLTPLGTSPANAALGIGRRNNVRRLTFIGNNDTVKNFAETVLSNPGPTRANSVILEDDWKAFDSTNPYPRYANFSGPGGLAEYTQNSLGAIVEIEPVKNLFIELAAVNETRKHDVYDTTHEVNRIIGEPGQTFRDGTPNPYAGLYYIDSRWVLRHEDITGERYRATLSYELDLGKLGRHKLGGLISRDNDGNPRYVGFLVTSNRAANTTPQAAANQIWTRQYVTNPADPSQFAAPDFRRIPTSFSVAEAIGGGALTDHNLYWSNNELVDQWQHIDSRLATLQSSFWNSPEIGDRIITTLGYRYNKREAFTRPTSAPTTAGAEFAFTGAPAVKDTYDFERISYGVVMKALKQLSFYYNYSENAQIPSLTQTLIPDGSLFPLNSGEGEDYGVMLNLFKERVFIRAGYFTTTSVNQSSAFGVNNLANGDGGRNRRINETLVANGRLPANTVTVAGGDFDLADLATDGYEVNLTANLTPSWRLVFNASYAESVQTDLLKRARALAPSIVPTWEALSPADKALITTGTTTIQQEIDAYYAWLQNTTSVEGKGTVGHRELELRAFTRYEFKDRFIKGLFVGGGYRYGSAPIIGSETSTGNFFTSPIQREVDLLLGYKRRVSILGHNTNMEIQLNAYDLLQQKAYTLMRRNGDGQIFRAVVNAPTRYTLSTRFSF